jgi:hypothetical protein
MRWSSCNLSDERGNFDGFSASTGEALVISLESVAIGAVLIVLSFTLFLFPI